MVFILTKMYFPTCLKGLFDKHFTNLNIWFCEKPERVVLFALDEWCPLLVFCAVKQ